MIKIKKIINFIIKDFSLRDLSELHKNKCKKQWEETDWKSFHLY